jgi:GNAT superfamily N-acetyltransferase
MRLQIVRGNEIHLRQVLQWLRRDYESTGEGFYCNPEIIEEWFHEGKAVCALSNEHAVAFATFNLYPPGSKVSIVEVDPQHRCQGIGTRLMRDLLRRLKRQGATYANAECTSAEGEALCVKVGFRPIAPNARRAHIRSFLRYDFNGPSDETSAP